MAKTSSPSHSIHSSIYSGDIKNEILANLVVGDAPWKPKIQIVYRGDTHVLIAIWKMHMHACRRLGTLTYKCINT